MKVFIEKEKKEKHLVFSGKVSGMLKKLNIDASEALVVREGEVLLDSDEVSGDDEIRVLSVVSGG
jgi:sulfur carrier protein ThiS